MVTKPDVSIGFCKPTLRGIGRTQPELSWHADRMLRRFFNLHYSDEPDFLIYGDDGAGEHLMYPSRTIRIFVTGENIAPNWDEADYALTHQRVYSERHWRIPLHRHWYDTTCTEPMRNFTVVRSRVDRFCNFIYSNPRAHERIVFFDLLSHYKPVDSPGKVRNNIAGTLQDKYELLNRCKFTIAFENESDPGYATEKILQPLIAGSIPIYWGDPTIELDFNPDCLVNVHRFESFEAAIEEVIRIDEDDTLWEKYVTAPIFRDGKIPYELSDEAIAGFFGRVFTGRRRHVSRMKKTAQKTNLLIRASRAYARADSIRRGGERRVKALMARLGLNG